VQFSDESDKGTASNIVQISEKVRQRPWQLLDSCSGRKHEPNVESPKLMKSKVNLIIFFDIKGTVHKEFVLAGQAVDFAYYRDFYGNCVKMC
jgi:hypothetical protein